MRIMVNYVIWKLTIKKQSRISDHSFKKKKTKTQPKTQQRGTYPLDSFKVFDIHYIFLNNSKYLISLNSNSLKIQPFLISFQASIQLQGLLPVEQMWAKLSDKRSKVWHYSLFISAFKIHVVSAECIPSSMVWKTSPVSVGLTKWQGNGSSSNIVECVKLHNERSTVSYGRTWPKQPRVIGPVDVEGSRLQGSDLKADVWLSLLPPPSIFFTIVSLSSFLPYSRYCSFLFYFLAPTCLVPLLFLKLNWHRTWAMLLIAKTHLIHIQIQFLKTTKDLQPWGVSEHGARRRETWALIPILPSNNSCVGESKQLLEVSVFVFKMNPPYRDVEKGNVVKTLYK